MIVKGQNKISMVFAFNEEARKHTIDLLTAEKKKNLSFDADIVVGIDPIVKEGDIVSIPFRLLSATIVGADSYKCTDFSKQGVLESAVRLFNEKPVYLNHEMEVGNEVGYIDNARFTRSYTNADGIIIPSGIDADKNFDSKLYPDLVRKMTGKVPYVKSSSVTVVFEWEASHEFENENDFYWHVGETINGEMVRRIATSITEVYESSLVWLGADPYAGILDENLKVKFVDKAGVVGFSADVNTKEVEQYQKEGRFYVGTCFSKEKNSNLHKKDMEIVKLLATKLGVSETDITSEKLEGLHFISDAEKEALSKVDLEKYIDIASFKAKENEVVSLQSEVTSLKEEKTSLETEIASLKFDATIGKNVISKMKEEVLASYTKSVDGKVNELIVKEIQEETSLEKLQAKGELFGYKAVEHFGGKCEDCGSTNFTFRSSKPTKEDNDSYVVGGLLDNVQN